MENLERLSRGSGGDVIAEGGLHEAELGERNACHPSVGVMTDLGIDAESGAKDPVMAISSGLNFEMDSWRQQCGFHYSRIGTAVKRIRESMCGYIWK